MQGSTVSRLLSSLDAGDATAEVALKALRSLVGSPDAGAASSSAAELLQTPSLAALLSAALSRPSPPSQLVLRAVDLLAASVALAPSSAKPRIGRLTELVLRAASADLPPPSPGFPSPQSTILSAVCCLAAAALEPVAPPDHWLPLAAGVHDLSCLALFDEDDDDEEDEEEEDTVEPGTASPGPQLRPPAVGDAPTLHAAALLACAQLSSALSTGTLPPHASPVDAPSPDLLGLAALRVAQLCIASAGGSEGAPPTAAFELLCASLSYCVRAACAATRHLPASSDVVRGLLRTATLAVRVACACPPTVRDSRRLSTVVRSALSSCPLVVGLTKGWVFAVVRYDALNGGDEDDESEEAGVGVPGAGATWAVHGVPVRTSRKVAADVHDASTGLAGACLHAVASLASAEGGAASAADALVAILGGDPQGPWACTPSDVSGAAGAAGFSPQDLEEARVVPPTLPAFCAASPFVLSHAVSAAAVACRRGGDPPAALRRVLLKCWPPLRSAAADPTRWSSIMTLQVVSAVVRVLLCVRAVGDPDPADLVALDLPSLLPGLGAGAGATGALGVAATAPSPDLSAYRAAVESASPPSTKLLPDTVGACLEALLAVGLLLQPGGGSSAPVLLADVVARGFCALRLGVVGGGGGGGGREGGGAGAGAEQAEEGEAPRDTECSGTVLGAECLTSLLEGCAPPARAALLSSPPLALLARLLALPPLPLLYEDDELLDGVGGALRLVLTHKA